MRKDSEARVSGRMDFPTPIRWTDDGRALLLLDQTLLPGEERYLRLETVEEVAEAIRSLRVRGAPAIGIAAALALAMGVRSRIEDPKGLDLKEVAMSFRRDVELLRGTRPTAVNLPWALDRMTRAFSRASRGVPETLAVALRAEADDLAREDREMCRLIGVHGAELIPEAGAGILTHCNAGALATGGMGTALAPVYTAHGRGVPVRLFACETRPLLQGARLTAWEAGKVGVDVTVITDSMAGSLMAGGAVGLVMVGADRVAANGDTANKIGTYCLAILAHHHGIPFYVALPRSTFDRELEGGGQIPIEERGALELTGPGGTPLPLGVKTWTPAFDVTPAELITAFITDGGTLRPPFGPAIRDLLENTAAPSGVEPDASQENPS